jgi:hypothetical protein
VPVTGRGGPQGFETSRLTYFVDNRLTVGGEDVSLAHRSTALTPVPKENSWYSFSSEVKSGPGP